MPDFGKDWWKYLLGGGLGLGLGALVSVLTGGGIISTLLTIGLAVVGALATPAIMNQMGIGQPPVYKSDLGVSKVPEIENPGRPREMLIELEHDHYGRKIMMLVQATEDKKHLDIKDIFGVMPDGTRKSLKEAPALAAGLPVRLDIKDGQVDYSKVFQKLGLAAIEKNGFIAQIPVKNLETALLDKLAASPAMPPAMRQSFTELLNDKEFLNSLGKESKEGKEIQAMVRKGEHIKDGKINPDFLKKFLKVIKSDLKIGDDDLLVATMHNGHVYAAIGESVGEQIKVKAAFSANLETREAKFGKAADGPMIPFSNDAKSGIAMGKPEAVNALVNAVDKVAKTKIDKPKATPTVNPITVTAAKSSEKAPTGVEKYVYTVKDKNRPGVTYEFDIDVVNGDAKLDNIKRIIRSPTGGSETSTFKVKGTDPGYMASLTKEQFEELKKGETTAKALINMVDKRFDKEKFNPYYKDVNPLPLSTDKPAPPPAPTPKLIDPRLEASAAEMGVGYYIPAYLQVVVERNGITLSEQQKEHYGTGYRLEESLPHKLSDAIRHAYEKDRAFLAASPEDAAKQLMELPETKKFIVSFDAAKQAGIRKELRQFLADAHPSFASAQRKINEHQAKMKHLADIGENNIKVTMGYGPGRSGVATSLHGNWQDNRPASTVRNMEIEASYYESGRVSVDKLHHRGENGAPSTEIELVEHGTKVTEIRIWQDGKQFVRWLNADESNALTELYRLEGAQVNGYRNMVPSTANVDKLTKLIDTVAAIEIEGPDKKKHTIKELMLDGKPRASLSHAADPLAAAAAQFHQEQQAGTPLVRINNNLLPKKPVDDLGLAPIA